MDDIGKSFCVIVYFCSCCPLLLCESPYLLSRVNIFFFDIFTSLGGETGSPVPIIAFRKQEEPTHVSDDVCEIQKDIFRAFPILYPVHGTGNFIYLP